MNHLISRTVSIKNLILLIVFIVSIMASQSYTIAEGLTGQDLSDIRRGSTFYDPTAVDCTVDTSTNPSANPANSSTDWTGKINEATDFAKKLNTKVGFTVAEAGTGNIIGGYEQDLSGDIASMVKPFALAAYLDKNKDKDITNDIKQKLTRMIVDSSQSDLNSIKNELGGNEALANYIKNGLKFDGTPPTDGDSIVSSKQMAVAYARLEDAFPQKHREFAMGLLSSISAPHQWGMIPAAKSQNWQWYVKAGWLENNVHQTGIFKKGNDKITISIMQPNIPTPDKGSDGDPDSEQGHKNIEQIASILLKSTSTATTTPNKNNNIYVVGDSISQGSDENGFANKLKNNGYKDVLINGSNGRSITGKGASRDKSSGLDAIKKDEKFIKNAGVALVILGTNPEPKQDFDKQITEFINKIRSINKKIDIAWVNVGVTYPQLIDNQNKVNDILMKHSIGMKIIDWNSEVKQKPDLLGDSIHPANYSEFTDFLIKNLSNPAQTITDNTITKEQKIAQTFMVGFSSSDTETMKSVVSKYKIGGIFFVTGEDNRGLNKQFFTDLAKSSGSKMFIASDDEGGEVSRFTKGVTPSAADMGKMSVEEVKAKGVEAGKILADRGLTGDLAPVLDIATDGTPWTQYGRNWSNNPDEISSKAGAFASGLYSNGIKPVYKHFPGIGKVTENTDDKKTSAQSLASLSEDLKPYANLAGKNGGAIMLSNGYVSDWGDTPVSLNSNAVAYLRDNMHYGGAIMTDALNVLSKPKYEASAIQLNDAIIKAMRAGVDMPLFVASGDVDAQIASAIQAVSKDVSEATINQAYTKSLSLRNLAQTQKDDISGKCCASSSAAPDFGKGTLPSIVPEPYNSIFTKAAASTGIKPSFLYAVFVVENSDAMSTTRSGGVFDVTKFKRDPPPPYGTGQSWPTSDAGANGPFQFLNSTWKGQSNNGYNADGNGDGKMDIQDLADGAFGAAKYLKELLSRANGDNAKAAAGYNSGNPNSDHPDAVAYGKAADGIMKFIDSGLMNPLKSSDTVYTPTGASNTSCSNSEYKNPLRDVQNLQPLRIDGGVDYSGHGPIYPIGNAEIVMVNGHTSGWPGQTTSGGGGTYISYKLLDGPAKDKEIFMAENCEIPSNLKKGDKITPETVICDFQGEQYAWGEMGWANGSGSFIGNNCYDQSAHTVYGINFSDLMVTVGAPAGQWQAGYHVSCQLPSDWPKWPKKSPDPDPSLGITGSIR